MLHRIIPGIVAIGAVVAGCNGSDNTGTGDCAVTHEQKTITTTEPAKDPGLQFKIDTCRVDADACPTLCALAMTQAGIPFNNGGQVQNGNGTVGIDTPTSPPGGLGGNNGAPVTPTVNCDVTFEDGTVSMVVSYDVYTSTLGCPVQVGGGNTTTGAPVPFNGGPK